MAYSFDQAACAVAHHFVSYLQSKNVLKENGVHRDTLLKHYTDYLAENPTFIPRYEILRYLRKAKLIVPPKINPDGTPTSTVRFKGKLFQSAYQQQQNAQSAAAFEDFVCPKIRVFTNQRIVFRNKIVRETGVDMYHCEICKIDLKDSLAYNDHLKCITHVLRDMYRTNRKSLTALLSSFKLEGSTSFTLRIKEEKMYSVTFLNSFDKLITVQRVFSLIHVPSVKLECVCPQKVQPGSTFELNIKARFDTHVALANPVIIQLLLSEKEEPQNVLVELHFHAQDQELDSLAPESEYKRPVKKAVCFYEMPIVPGEPVKISTAGLKLRPLPMYKVPSYIIRILNHRFENYPNMKPEDEQKLKQIKALVNDDEGKVCKNLTNLNIANYAQRFELLLWMEEHQKTLTIRTYDRCDQTLRKVRSNFLELDVPGLSEGRPSLMRGDSVYVKMKSKDALYEGIVHTVRQETVVLGFNSYFAAAYIPGTKVDVQFSFSRLPFQLSYRALRQVGELREAAKWLFPDANGGSTDSANQIRRGWYNKKIEDNEEQKQAVQNIVEGTAYPAPYIIFGPPGTGKTVTVVEAIKQLWSLKKGPICVCAPSNSAADVLAKRLLEHVPASEIFRMYAFSWANVPHDDLLACSNYEKLSGEIYFPDAQFIKRKSIVVVTLVTAGRLVSAKDPVNFRYLFIDEAGHSIEPEALIPIMGLLSSVENKKRVITGQLVLAGDPKQLGPIIASPLAHEMGLGMSLLERLTLQCNLYAKGGSISSEAYNPKVITRLRNNYRSHKVLLHIPNKLFYDNELQEKGDRNITGRAAQFAALPKPGFPLLFHGVKGLEEREGDSPSFFNRQEIGVLLDYLDKLVRNRVSGYLVREEDIGVISPYRKQVQKIRKLFEKRKWSKITVGSVEEFQGQEKLIILVSTVRSRFEFLADDYKFGLGFLRNPKRFNVTLTRAQSLLIVVGNPDILQCDPNWRELMDYCQRNNSFVGYKPASPPPDHNPCDDLALDLSTLAIKGEQKSRNIHDDPLAHCEQ